MIIDQCISDQLKATCVMIVTPATDKQKQQGEGLNSQGILIEINVFLAIPWQQGRYQMIKSPEINTPPVLYGVYWEIPH